MSDQTPHQIEFDDIRKGDDIEARWAVDGLHLTRRGVAHHRNSRYWYTEEGGALASSHDGGWTHYLHSRPAPTEPESLGAVVRAALINGGGAWVFTRVGDGWVTRARNWHAWSDFDPDSVEVLSEGIGEES